MAALGSNADRALPRRRSVTAFGKAQSVALRILEPGGLEPLGGLDITLLLKPGQIVMFEENPLVFQLLNFLFEIIDLNGQSSRLVGSGEWRAIDVDQGI